MTSRVVNPGARVLVVGGGYSGLRFARAAAGLGAQVWLTHRRDLPEAQGVTEPLTWLRFDADAGAIPDLPEDLTHALITLPPHAAGSDAALMHLLEPRRRQPLRWLGYLSTTGVYGDSQGGWVDETSPPQPTPGPQPSPPSVRTAVAEQRPARAKFPASSHLWAGPMPLRAATQRPSAAGA